MPTPAGIALLAAALVAAMPAAGLAADTRVRLATLAPKGSSFHQRLLAMGERWRAATNGRVALTVFPDGTMGGEADVVRRMRIGQLQAAMLTVVGLSEIDPSVTALGNVPLLFQSFEELDHVRERLAPALEARLEAKGFVVLFWGDAGWVRFFTREPVEHPDDLKRMRLFVWSGEVEQAEIMRRAGYHPVPLEPTDILPGLSTGLIDGVPAVPYFALASQVYGTARHMLDLEWAPLVGATVVSKRAWEAIPPADRPALLTAAREVGATMRALGRAEAEAAVATMQARGLTVHRPGPEARRAWQRAVEALYPEIRGRLVPADLFDEVHRLVREYRASGGSAR